MKSSFKSKILYIIIFIIVFTIITSYGLIYYNRSLPVQYSFTGLKEELEPENIIYLEQLGLGNFTCTGLTFSYNSNTFWIADFGAYSIDEKRTPRLIEVDNTFSSIKRILELKELSGDINLQGIDFDDNNDTIWLATGDSVYNITTNGVIINQINLQDYKNLKSNGIYYDETKKNIYVLLASKYILQYDINGDLINKIKLNYFNQDHIFFSNNTLLLTVGADYKGNDNFVLKIENDYKTIFRVNASYAIEGLTIVGDKLYILNDGYYHNAKINKSYVTVYDADVLKN